jgi:hypothetical protein
MTAALGTTAPLYQPQPWKCLRCGTTGVVLLRTDDATWRQEFRRDQSHRAKQRRDECPDPLLVWR